MKVLVIEDDVAVRETLGMVLEAFGHSPVLVENGNQAVAKLGELWPDAVLLDLTLEESTGEQVYDQIRQAFGKVPPTIVISALQQGARRASTMPGVLYLPKPYAIEDLIQILEDAVQGKRGAA